MKNYITKKEWEESTGRKAKGSSFIGEVKWARNYNKCYEASPFTLIDDLRRRIYEEYWEAKRLYDDFSLNRVQKDPGVTIGELKIGPLHVCWILEDPVRRLRACRCLEDQG